MPNCKSPVLLIFAGLMIGGIALPARAEDQPADRKASPVTQPAEGGLQFPVLARLRSAVEELKLTDEQNGKIARLFEDARAQLKEARDSASGDRQEIGKKTRQVFNQLRNDLMASLDDDQKAELKAKLQSLSSGRNGGGDVIGRLRAALESLTLGGDQKRLIKDVLERGEKKIKDLREKAQAGDQDAREKVGSVMRDTRQKIGDILTEHQKQQLQDALQQPGERQRPARSATQQSSNE